MDSLITLFNFLKVILKDEIEKLKNKEPSVYTIDLKYYIYGEEAGIVSNIFTVEDEKYETLKNKIKSGENIQFLVTPYDPYYLQQLSQTATIWNSTELTIVPKELMSWFVGIDEEAICIVTSLPVWLMDDDTIDYAMYYPTIGVITPESWSH